MTQPFLPAFRSGVLRGTLAAWLLIATALVHALGLGLGQPVAVDEAAGWRLAAPAAGARIELATGQVQTVPLGEVVVGAFESARVLVPGVPSAHDRYQLEFELRPEGAAPVRVGASALVGRAGDASGERLVFDFGAEPVRVSFGRGGVLSVRFRPLDLADNGRYDLYAEVRLVTPPAELPEPDLVWQLGLGLILLVAVRAYRRRR